MAYEPTVWQDGDVITSDKLNKIENGIGSFYAYYKKAVSIADDPVLFSDSEFQNPVTYNMIRNALILGKSIHLVYHTEEQGQKDTIGDLIELYTESYEGPGGIEHLYQVKFAVWMNPGNSDAIKFLGGTSNDPDKPLIQWSYANSNS